jgi:NADH-quinone oxidoreductase subunit A
MFGRTISRAAMAVPAPVLTPAGLEPAFDLTAYYPSLIYVGVIAGLAISMLAATHIGYFLPFLKPQRPTKVKQMPYESGMDPIGSARMQFDIKFYLIAILFLVFDVELLFLYPWAVIAFTQGSDPFWHDAFGQVVFYEILIFLATLVIAYAYSWRKGVFQWR